jgi:hypothetical protein
MTFARARRFAMGLRRIYFPQRHLNRAWSRIPGNDQSHHDPLFAARFQMGNGLGTWFTKLSVVCHHNAVMLTIGTSPGVGLKGSAALGGGAPRRRVYPAYAYQLAGGGRDICICGYVAVIIIDHSWRTIDVTCRVGSGLWLRSPFSSPTI